MNNQPVNTDTSISDTNTITEKEEDKPIEAKSVTLNKTSVDLKVLQTFTLTTTVNPYNAYVKSYKWVSTNTSVVTVSEYGLVAAVGVGTATVKVVLDNGVSASCQFTVTKDKEVADLTPNNFSKYLEITVVRTDNNTTGTIHFQMIMEVKNGYNVKSKINLKVKIGVTGWYYIKAGNKNLGMNGSERYVTADLTLATNQRRNTCTVALTLPDGVFLRDKLASKSIQLLTGQVIEK
jgi:uncharacterized protein YjdB